MVLVMISAQAASFVLIVAVLLLRPPSILHLRGGNGNDDPFGAPQQIQAVCESTNSVGDIQINLPSLPSLPHPVSTESEFESINFSNSNNNNPPFGTSNDVAQGGASLFMEAPDPPQPDSDDIESGVNLFDMGNEYLYTEADKALLDAISKFTETTFPPGRIFANIKEAKDCAQMEIGDKYGFRYSKNGHSLHCMNCEKPKPKKKKKPEQSGTEKRKQKEWRLGYEHKISLTHADSKNRKTDKRVKMLTGNGRPVYN